MFTMDFTIILLQNAAIENHLFGRNKRFLQRPYPVTFYDRTKRYVTSKDIRSEILLNYLGKVLVLHSTNDILCIRYNNLILNLGVLVVCIFITYIVMFFSVAIRYIINNFSIPLII